MEREKGNGHSNEMSMSIERFWLDCRIGIGFGFGFGFTTSFGWLVYSVYLLWFWFYDSQVKTALKHITNTYRNHFSRSYQNRQSLCCFGVLSIITRRGTPIEFINLQFCYPDTHLPLILQCLRVSSGPEHVSKSTFKASRFLIFEDPEPHARPSPSLSLKDRKFTL